MIAMTQTLNNASEFQGGTSLYQGTAGIIRPGPQLYVAWKTELKYSSQSGTQLSTQTLSSQPAVLCLVLSWLPGWIAISPLKGGDAGVANVPALCR